MMMMMMLYSSCILPASVRRVMMRGFCSSTCSFCPPLVVLLLPLLLLDLFPLCAGVIVAEGSESLLQLPQSEDTGYGSRKAFSVDDFGAVGDGISDDTKAFKDAWEMACSLPFPSVLKIPAGSKYLVWPIDFAGHCRSSMTLLVSGTIIAPDDPAVWNHLDPHKWLSFHGINHLVVRGGGTINGMGEKWWARSCKIKRTNPCRHAPTAIAFHRCKNLRIKDLMLVDSQQMHMAFTNCSDVKVSGVKITAPATSPNTDGIHISASVSVTVRDSLIMTGDDCISIVSHSSKVRIKDIRCGPGHGISIGSLGKSNSWSEVYDVRVNGAVISNTENGLRIKTWQGGQGFARNIAFKNIVMNNVSNPIIIDQYYCDSSHSCPNQTHAVKVGNISFIDIKGTSATEDAIRFACSDSFPCEKVFLKDIDLLLSDDGGNTKAYCWMVSGSSSGLVHPPPCFSSNDGPNLLSVGRGGGEEFLLHAVA